MNIKFDNNETNCVDLGVHRGSYVPVQAIPHAVNPYIR